MAKPAVPVLNIPMWCYPLGLIESLGISDLHINTHHLPETVKLSFKRHARVNYSIHFHHEDHLLGSARPLLHFENEINRKSQEPILVANGDAVMICKNPNLLKEMINYHYHNRALATVLAVPKEGAGKDFSGVWSDSTQNYVGIGTTSPHSDSKPFHYASIMILSPDIYSYISDQSKNIFLDVLNEARKKREKIRIFTTKDIQFYETGSLKDLLATHNSLLEILKSDQSHWNLIDLMDRFQPGWRNYQKNFTYRNERLDRVRFKNENEHLVLLAPGQQPLQSDQIQQVQVQGPSTVYRWEKALPESLNGCYWGDFQLALLNSGELVEF